MVCALARTHNKRHVASLDQVCASEIDPPVPEGLTNFVPRVVPPGKHKVSADTREPRVRVGSDAIIQRHDSGGR